jgi:hypothetical protein
VGMTDVVVRRRPGLMIVVALLSGSLAIAYLVLYQRDDDARALVVSVLLAAVCAGHLLAWRAARKPLLVADSTGVRLRLGAGWTGLPWDLVDHVEVADRDRLRDGQVVVVPRADAPTPIKTGLRGRLSASLNRRLYDEPLAVPFGVTTSVSVVDIASSLDRLSAGRTEIVVVDDDTQVPEPTVAVTGSAADGDSSALETPERAADERAAPLDAAGQEAPPEELPAKLPRRSLRSVLASRSLGAETTRRQVVATTTPAARREDITMPPRSHPMTVGGLALSEPVQPVQPVEPVQPAAVPQPLPEASQLRRAPYDAKADRSGGNVSLIIDATTDLSARAMQRVRRPAAEQERAVDAAEREPPDYGAVIGGELASARTRLGIDVDELAERTRIRPSVIESIEADDFTACGGDFYARGHIRMIARVVGLDPGPLVAAYDEHFATSPVNPREIFEVELASGRGGLIRGGERSSNWPVLVAAVLVLVMVWAVARYLADGSGPAPAATEPSTTVDGLGSPGPGNPPVEGPRTAHVKVSLEGGETRVVVKDRFKQLVFSGVLPDGAERKFQGEAPLRVRALDGGVVSLSVKGKPLGLMGEPGQSARERVSGVPERTQAEPGGRPDSGRTLPAG